MSEHAPPIFLSYASEDAAAARRIAEALGASGLTIWFDQSELRGGDAWDQRIRRQIKECGLFLPVISAHTQARAEGYFRLEWHLAEQRSYLMAHDRPFIVPVVVDDTPDAGARVPDRFRERQWTRIPGGVVPSDFAGRMAQLMGVPVPVVRTPPEKAQAASATDRSVAILAFTNLSDDRENEYFSDGVSDELMTVLQAIPGLRVAARTSAFSFKGKNATVREIGSQLNVAHLVEGGVQKSGNRVKVVARLTNVATGVAEWSRSYTREIKDVFALQEELAVAIVSELRGQLTGDEAALVQQANRGGTRNPEAYESFLLGKHLYEQHSEKSIASATEHLRRATDLDPSFALAWVSLGAAHLWRSSFQGDLTREQFDSAQAYARMSTERGLQLEPTLPLGLYTRFTIQVSFDFDLVGAAATLQRAKMLAPNDRDVLTMELHFLSIDESPAKSLRVCQRLVALDPINPRPYLLLSGLLAESGRFEEAHAAAARYCDINPTGILAHSIQAWIYGTEGQFAAGELALPPDADGWHPLYIRSIIYNGLGRAADSDAALAELVRRYGDTGAVQIAEVHAARGESDLAFEWLERARHQRDPGIFQTYRTPFFDPVRGDPRWGTFWRSVGVVRPR